MNSTLTHTNTTLTDETTSIPWWKGDWRYWFYFIAHTLGGAGLSLLLLTMCLPLRRVRRNPILISMCFSWWIGSFPNLTLLFFTNDVLGAPPSQGVCLASAALTMAQTPLNAVCAVMLVYNVWSVLYFNSTHAGYSPARTFLLVIIPYVIFLICAAAVVTVGLIRPELVSRATFYCVVHSNVLMIFLGIFGGTCCVASIALEIWIGILLRQNRGRSAPTSKSSGGGGLDLQLAVRVILFGFYIFAGLALSILSIINWTSVVPDLCFSTFSIAVFAIFGSQQDIVRVWKRFFCCCLAQDEQDSGRNTSHIRTFGTEKGANGFPDDGKNGDRAHNPYWYRGTEKKSNMADLATLNTRGTTTQTQIATTNRSPYNSHTDFQFQYECDPGVGSAGSQGKTQGDPKATGEKHKAGKKSKDNWWVGNKNGGRPGTGGSAKRPGTANSAMSMSWYPDLGYDFVPEGTSHTEDHDVGNDVSGVSGPGSGSAHSPDSETALMSAGSRSGKGHANPNTRRSSTTVPSEYTGLSPQSPEFVYYQPQATLSQPHLPAMTASPSSMSERSPLPSPIPPPVDHESGGQQSKPTQFTFPPTRNAEKAHAPAVHSRLHIEHRPGDSTDTTGSSVEQMDGHHIGLPAENPNSNRESTDGLPEYYLRQHSHAYVHSTDYRSSLDSSIRGGRGGVRGGDPRAGVPSGTGPTTLYDSDYPYTFDFTYTHSNMSTKAVDHQGGYAPPPKSAFDRDNAGFQFISGRRGAGANSPDSFQTNPSLYNYSGKAY